MHKVTITIQYMEDEQEIKVYDRTNKGGCEKASTSLIEAR